LGEALGQVLDIYLEMGTADFMVEYLMDEIKLADYIFL
jgi:hypothetical protein